MSLKARQRVEVDFPRKMGRSLALLLDAIIEAREPQTAAQIREITGLPKSSVGPTLLDLANRNVLVRSEHPTATYIGSDGQKRRIPRYEFADHGVRDQARAAIRKFALRKTNQTLVALP